jgi:uncharacterized protein (DUF983 family)
MLPDRARSRPSGDGIEAQRATRGLGRRLGLAVLRRCPWCGDRQAWFRGWLGQAPRCRSCGLQRTRSTEGHELGSLTVNLVLNLGLVLLVMTVAIVLTVPEVPVVGLLVLLGVVGVAAPILSFPISQTIWMAIDLTARPPQVDELADAHLWLVGQAVLGERGSVGPAPGDGA